MGFRGDGRLGSEEAAHRWADRNDIDPRDVHVRSSGRGVKLEVRRSALGDSGGSHKDLRDGRRDGW